MDKIKIKVEGRFYEVDSHLTILEAAREIGYNIPTLCYWNKGHNSLASCAASSNSKCPKSTTDLS